MNLTGNWSDSSDGTCMGVGDESCRMNQKRTGPLKRPDPEELPSGSGHYGFCAFIRPKLGSADQQEEIRSIY